MQRLTIVADDSKVYVDGVALKVDLTGLDPQIHAIQWNGSRGEIEHRPYDEKGNRRPNAFFTDISAYKVFVNRWSAAKAAEDAAIAARRAAMANTVTSPSTSPALPKPVNVIA
jgi:hypothetical protein